MRRAGLSFVGLLCVSGCSIPFYTGAILSHGYSHKTEKKTPIAPYDERVSLLAFNAKKLLFRCEVSKTAAETQVTTTTTRFGPGLKLPVAMVGMVELMGAGITLALDAGDEIDLPPAAKVGAGLAVADGIALISAMAFKTRIENTITTEPSTPEILTQCPLGTELAINGERYPLYSNGTTTPEGESAFGQVMLDPARGFRVIAPRQTIDVNPTAEDRCRWARGQESPMVATLCPQLIIPIPNLTQFRIQRDNVEITIKIN